MHECVVLTKRTNIITRFFLGFFFFSSLQCFNGTIGETKFLKRSKNRKEKKKYIYILIFSRKNKVEWFG